MPTQTPLLAATTAAGNTPDIIVGATPVTVILFATDGAVSFGVQCPAFRKVGAAYQPVPDDKGYVFLSAERLELTFYAAGTYQLRKPITPEAMGFMKDEV